MISEVTMRSPANAELLTPSDKELRGKRDVAGLLSTIGLVTIGYALTILVFGALPIKLLDPSWQLKAAGGFTSAGPFLLIGTMLSYLAKSFNDADQALLDRSILLRKICTWMAIVYLVMVPIQLHAGVKLLQGQAAQEAKSLAQWNKFKTRLQATSSMDELRTLLGTLKQPITLPPKITVPLATLKQQIIADAESRFNAFSYQSGEANSKRWQNFIGEATSSCLQTLLMAIGFAAFAQGRPGGPTLLARALTMVGKGPRRRG